MVCPSVEGDAARGGGQADHARRVVDDVGQIDPGAVGGGLGAGGIGLDGVVAVERRVEAAGRRAVGGIVGLGGGVDSVGDRLHHRGVAGVVGGPRPGEDLVDGAEGCVDEREVVVEAAGIAQAREVEFGVVGLSPLRDGSRRCRVAGDGPAAADEIAVRVVYRTRAVPKDDGVARRIEQGAEVDLAEDEVDVALVDHERLEIIRHDALLPGLTETERPDLPHCRSMSSPPWAR
ncbi:hypothetical protein ACVWZL_005873 [Bradyrhizobium sp. GM2.4]